MPGPLNGLTAALYTSDVTPTPTSTMDQFTLAVLSGAGTALDALLGPKNFPGNKIGYAQWVQWDAAADPTNETVHGIVIFEAGSPNVYRGGYRLPAPIEIFQEGDSVGRLLIFALPTTWPTGLNDPAAA